MDFQNRAGSRTGGGGVASFSVYLICNIRNKMSIVEND